MEAEFFHAARDGHEGEVIRLLDADPTLLERDRGDGDRPLAAAARDGELGVVRLLIERGANINATGRSDRTALYYAAQRGHEEMVAYLLSQGAQAGSRSDNGTTPLMKAGDNGHLRVVKMLVQHMRGHGLDESDDEYMWTALHGAASNGHAEVVRFLLLAGADPTLRDRGGRTPRAITEEQGYSRDMTAGRVRCLTIFEWWEGEFERRAVLCRATCLHKVAMAQRDMPTSEVPTYLEARVAAGHAVPLVEVVSPQSQDDQEEEKDEEIGGSGSAQGAGAEEEEVHAVVEYVVKGLNEELVTELLEGFHCGK